MTLNATPLSKRQSRRTEIRSDTVTAPEVSLPQLVSECIQRNHSLHEAIAEMVRLAQDDAEVLSALVTEYFMVVVSADHGKPAAEPQSKRQTSRGTINLNNDPSPLNLHAARRAQQRIAESLMDLLYIDRKPIGDWTIGECQSAAVGKFREAQILRSIGRKFVNVDPKARVRDAIKVEDLQKIVKDAGAAVSEAFDRRDQ